MQYLIEALSDKIVFVILGICFVAAIVVRAVTVVITGQSRERSRREIAAYIAEGSITPEQGERLLKAHVSGGPPAQS